MLLINLAVFSYYLLLLPSLVFILYILIKLIYCNCQIINTDEMRTFYKYLAFLFFGLLIECLIKIYTSF